MPALCVRLSYGSPEDTEPEADIGVFVCVCAHPFLLLLSYYGDPSLQGHWRSLQLCINTEIIIHFCFHFDV